MTEQTRKADQPIDALAALGEQMLAEFEKAAGEIKDARAIVLVSLHGRGGISMSGYEEEDGSRAAADLFVHLRAILRAYGKDAVLIGPDDREAPAPSSPARPSRILTKEERRIVTDALRLAAAETRKVRTAAVSDTRYAFTSKQTAHIDELSRLAGTQDRLAAELADLDIRLERTLS